MIEEQQRCLGMDSVWRNIIRVGKDVDKVGVQFTGFGKQLGDGSEKHFWEDR